MTPTDLTGLERATRQTVWVSALGALLLLLALLYASLQLASLQERRHELESTLESINIRLSTVKDSLASTRSALSSARCALATSRAAITAFHQRRYREALALYDEALSCDSTNAYLLNLKAYAAFKSNDLPMAIHTQLRSLQADSTYAWGYFDLARFYCATSPKRLQEAKAAAARAISIRPGLYDTMRGDGEFAALCGPAFFASLPRPSD